MIQKIYFNPKINRFMEYIQTWNSLQAKFMEWQESLWFEAELEAEHAAEQQAATKKAKVEVEPEQVEGVIKGRIECGAGAGEELYTASTSSEGYIVKLLRRVSR
jgi:ABC-type Fe3+/spermidine/putrescine transport system ATPase subunit